MTDMSTVISNGDIVEATWKKYHSGETYFLVSLVDILVRLRALTLCIDSQSVQLIVELLFSIQYIQTLLCVAALAKMGHSSTCILCVHQLIRVAQTSMLG